MIDIDKRHGDKHRSLIDLYNLNGVVDLFKGDSKNATINFELAIACFG
jgi:hypothetical protein